MTNECRKDSTTGEKADFETAVVSEGNETQMYSRIRSCQVSLTTVSPTAVLSCRRIPSDPPPPCRCCYFTLTGNNLNPFLFLTFLKFEALKIIYSSALSKLQENQKTNSSIDPYFTSLAHKRQTFISALSDVYLA
jgi:hypothetical protein